MIVDRNAHTTLDNALKYCLKADCCTLNVLHAVQEFLWAWLWAHRNCDAATVVPRRYPNSVKNSKLRTRQLLVYVFADLDLV